MQSRNWPAYLAQRAERLEQVSSCLGFVGFEGGFRVLESGVVAKITKLFSHKGCRET